MMGWQWHQSNHMQAICTSLQKITMPAPHHSDFYRPDALPDTQPTASKHWGNRTTVIHQQILKMWQDKHTQSQYLVVWWNKSFICHFESLLKHFLWSTCFFTIIMQSRQLHTAMIHSHISAYSFCLIGLLGDWRVWTGSSRELQELLEQNFYA